MRESNQSPCVAGPRGGDVTGDWCSSHLLPTSDHLNAHFHDHKPEDLFASDMLASPPVYSGSYPNFPPDKQVGSFDFGSPDGDILDFIPQDGGDQALRGRGSPRRGRDFPHTNISRGSKIPAREYDPEKGFLCSESGLSYKHCPICRKKITYNHMKRHIRTQHTDMQKVVCPYCARYLKNTYSLETHIANYHR